MSRGHPADETWADHSVFSERQAGDLAGDGQELPIVGLYGV